jgi:heme/copper-type cytochrome/quinol oxidase subunit 3
MQGSVSLNKLHAHETRLDNMFVVCFLKSFLHLFAVLIKIYMDSSHFNSWALLNTLKIRDCQHLESSGLLFS